MTDSVTDLTNLFGSAWHVNATAILNALGAASGAGTPNSVLKPSYVGQEYYDTTNKVFYIATDTTNTSWVLYTGTALAGSNTPEVATALVTVGAGTILAAGIVGGLVTRGGAQSGSAFTDTTDTAALIIAAQPQAAVGQSWEWTYENNTNAAATLAGGTGVTLSGNTIVPQNTWARFLVTMSGAATVTIQCLSAGPNVPLPDAQYVTAAGQSTTLTGAQVAGAKVCVYDNTGTTPGNLQMPTAANLIAAIPNAQIGQSYILKIRNSSGSANTATITTNTGITLTGTMTIAQSVTREFVVTYTAAAAVTVQSVGISAAGA